MDVLLAQLAREPAQVRRRWTAIAIGASLAIATLMVAVVGLKRSSLVCRGASAKLDGVWDEARRQATHARFTATGLPYAEDAFRTAARVLDRYTGSWAAMHTQACEATRLRGEQSEELLDLRMQCLSNRREELRAVTDLFTRADDQVVEKAAEVVGALGRIEECADAVTLKTPVRPPTDASTRSRLEAVHRRLAEARALEEAGKYSSALPIAQAATSEAHALSYPPLQAEALLVRGWLEHQTARDADAEETLVGAAAAALAGHDDTQAARAWTELLSVVGSSPARSADAHRWDVIAEAAVGRAGGDELHGDLAYARAQMFDAQSKHEAALAADQRSLEFYERALGPDDLRVARTLTGIGCDLASMGRAEEAIAYFERALARYEQLVGPDHPAAAMAIFDSGLLLSDQGRFDESLTRLRRALAIRERALGPDHPDVASALLGLAEVLERLGKYDDARDAANRALKIFEAKLGPESTEVAWALNRVAEILLAKGGFAEALTQYRRALGIWEKSVGPNDTRIAYALTGIGRALIGLHDARGAVPPLERAKKLRERSPGEAMLLAATDFALARALVQAGGNHERARSLATEARAGYLRVQAGWRKQLDEVDAWLATLTAP
jgi:tetratricopeptide (TPR) repeat protein